MIYRKDNWYSIHILFHSVCKQDTENIMGSTGALDDINVRVKVKLHLSAV
jgi:hypothetical protein